MKAIYALATVFCLLLASCGGSRGSSSNGEDSSSRLTRIDTITPLEEQIARLPGVLRNERGELRIRGSTSPPLFVVDGTPMVGQNLTFLNPADVESIEVLKGPETAMYGSRGGGGVIRIYTKRPPEPPNSQ